MGQFHSLLGQKGKLFRGNSPFVLFPGDIDFQQDVLDQFQLTGSFVDGFQQAHGVHRLDQVHPAHHLLDFVGLQMADKVQPCAGIGVVIQMGSHLLHPVFSADLYSGGNGGADGVGSLNLGGGDKGDLRRVPVRPQGGRGNALLDRRDVFF